MSYKTLNLTDLSKSDFKYSIYNYPDGEKHIVLHGTDWNKYPYVNVITRISSMDDLFVLLQVKEIFWHEDIRIQNLYVTYILGARCDRRFSLGEAIDARIIQNLVDSTAKNIYYLDAHSCINEDSKKPLVSNITNFSKKHLDLYHYNICYPDEGAARRYSSALKPHQARLIGEKHRKPDGISMQLNTIKNLDPMLPILVIDDLCDGGGTFNVLANELEDACPKYQREIWVTHAIQLSGIKLLASKYNKVYITNSYKNWENETLPENVTVIDVTDGSF